MNVIDNCDRIPIDTLKLFSLDSICDINSSLGEDMILYKYNEEKTLLWLENKVKNTSKLLAKHRLTKESATNTVYSSTFNVSMQITNSKLEITSNNDKQNEIILHEDKVVALQIICDYISDDLAVKLAEKLQLDVSILTSRNTNLKRKTDWENELEVNKYQMFAECLTVYLIIF